MEKLKIYAGIAALVITNATSIITAIIASNKADKADQEQTAKAAYKELSGAVEGISKEQAQMAKDIANLHGYIAGLDAAYKTPHTTTSPPSSSAPTISSLRPLPRMTSSAAGATKVYKAPDINTLPKQ